MMRFMSSAYTEAGAVKKVNQDAFCLKVASTSGMGVAMAVLCDGMGGLANGELASAFVVNAFSKWFDRELPDALSRGAGVEMIKKSWSRLVTEQNSKILEYGASEGRMGTTLSAILLLDGSFLIIQVGDSRIYRLSQTISQLTKDQSFVAREVEQGRMTPEEARVHPRRNEILQAVGIDKKLAPQFISGNLKRNEAILLCSDGFYHELTDNEMLGILAPSVLTSESVIGACLRDMAGEVKRRGEIDNITAILLKGV